MKSRGRNSKQKYMVRDCYEYMRVVPLQINGTLEHCSPDQFYKWACSGAASDAKILNRLTDCLFHDLKGCDHPSLRDTKYQPSTASTALSVRWFFTLNSSPTIQSVTTMQKCVTEGRFMYLKVKIKRHKYQKGRLYFGSNKFSPICWDTQSAIYVLIA